MAKTPVDRFESWESFLAELKKIKKSVSGKSTAGKMTATRTATGLKPTPRPAGAPPPNGLNLNRPQAAPPPAKRGKSKLLLAINYLLISILTAGAIVFMLSRSNTQSAENRMIEVRAAMKNVRENDKDPEGARDKIRRALAESRKFGVKKEVAQEIGKECAEELRFIESLEAENRQADEIRLTVSTLMAESVEALAALKRKVSPENLEALKQIRSKLMEQSAKILTITFTRPSNEEKMRQTVAAINSQTKVIADQLAAASSSGKKVAGTKPKAPVVDDKARRKKAEEEKLRRKERYRRSAEREKDRVAREIVLEVRRGNVDRAEQLLTAGPGMKAPDPDCRAMESAYNAWLSRIRAVYRETKPILKEVPPDIKNKKEKIYSLTGGNRKPLCHSLIFFGYFKEAHKLAQGEDQILLRDIAVAYLTPRIERAITNARKGNDKELVDLRQEYEFFEPYANLENKVRARMNGGK